MPTATYGGRGGGSSSSEEEQDSTNDANNGNKNKTSREQHDLDTMEDAARELYETEVDDDTIRIMVSTDNHVGFVEQDAVRGLDSFAALEEVLFLAKQYRVDMVLLAGDLFHDNKPSRRTLYKTMELFRKYCMGPNPIRIQVVSNQQHHQQQQQTTTNSREVVQHEEDNNKNKGRRKRPQSASIQKQTTASAPAPAFQMNNPWNNKMNYEDQFYSVDLPVFTIHGNHDDPTRDGGGPTTRLLAALDLLQVSNLVNYFGRQDQVNAIHIAPILIQKGSTNLALYGLGSMRDERLNRMWQSQKVKFLRPTANQEDNHNETTHDELQWFNLFALHQNRDLGRGAKNCIHESMIPEWMDLLVWGHEHECCIEVQESVVGTFRITQPGSSIATSLCTGESVLKQVGILDIRHDQFRLHPIPLTQVRTFVMSELSLNNAGDNNNTSNSSSGSTRRVLLDPEDPKIDIKLSNVLEEEIRLLIHQAREKTQETLARAKQKGNVLATMKDCPLINKLEKPEEVLIRLRVDHSGFSTLNNQRFGAKFIGQVANPTDLLLFHRKRAISNAASSSDTKKSNTPIMPEQLEEMNIEDLVSEQLNQSHNKLELFDEKHIGKALEEYVAKQQAQAIPEMIGQYLGRQQKRLIEQQPTTLDGDNDGNGSNEDEVAEEPEDDEENNDANGKRKRTVATTSRSSRKTTKKAEDDIDDLDADLAADATPKRRTASRRTTATTRTTRGGGKQAAATNARKRQRSKDDNDSDEYEDNTASTMQSRKSPRRRVATQNTKGRRGRAQDESGSEYEDQTKDEQLDGDMIVDDDSDDSKPPSKKKAASSKSLSIKSRLKTTKAKQSTSKKQSIYELDSDGDGDDDDDDDHNNENDSDNGSRKRRKPTTTSRSKTTTRSNKSRQNANNSFASSSSSQTSPKFSQSQLSFAPVTGSRNQRRSTKKTSYVDMMDDSDGDDDITPSRSYQMLDQDDDWGSAKTDTYKS